MYIIQKRVYNVYIYTCIFLYLLMFTGNHVSSIDVCKYVDMLYTFITYTHIYMYTCSICMYGYAYIGSCISVYTYVWICLYVYTMFVNGCWLVVSVRRCKC